MQQSAWRLQLPVLRGALEELVTPPPATPAPWIHLEFDIPRLGRRVDAVLVTSACVIPIEFKVGAKTFSRVDYEQAWDYGLDLKNFHAPSHAAAIFPILCATEARDSDHRWKPPHADGVRPSHTHDITRSDAGAVNLAATSGCIERIIAAAKAGRRKAIVFVTGVPGAGKTLVGLNVATRHGERSDAAHAVFLFGKARWWRCCGRPWPATTSTARGAPTRRPASAPPATPSAGGERRQDAEPGILRGREPVSRGPRSATGLGRPRWSTGLG